MKPFILFLSLLFCLTIYAQNSQKNVAIEIHEIKGYGEYENFAKISIEKLDSLLNSELFRVSFKKLKMTQKMGYTNSQLLNLIYNANELRGGSSEKNTIDIRLRVMSIEEDGKQWMDHCVIGSKAGTIGKEADSSGYTVTCKERIAIWAKNNNYGCMAGHIMHENLHNLGFKHRFYSKRKSFVYKTGVLVRNLIQGDTEPCPIN